MIIKICGIKTIHHARAAAEAGADMIGLNFHPPSPRCIDIETARAIAADLPDTVLAIGLFVNQPLAAIAQTALECGLDGVQIHGRPEAGARDALRNLSVIRAFSISAREDLARLREADADYVILDAAVPHLHGGTGTTCDWALARAARDHTDRPIMLAGGLTPENVAQAIAQAQPEGVDVASGVESSPGVKDADLIRRFIEAARQTD